MASICNRKSEFVVRQMSILFTAFYPWIFEKQKVTVALQVFNEKAIAALNMQGSVETARFVTLVPWMEKCLNIKSPKTC